VRYHHTPLQKCCDVWMTLNADISQRNCRVRFTPNSDRESGFPQTAMSALPPIADMCGATMDVRFGAIADIPSIHSITSSARPSSAGGKVRPRALAVLALRSISNHVRPIVCYSELAGRLV
jgi:hypothetical protein